MRISSIAVAIAVLGMFGNGARVKKPEEEISIAPSSVNGKVFYILGKSAAQNSCFCYKLEIGKALYQHTPSVNCDSYDNEKCEKEIGSEIASWNEVIGQTPVDSDDGMVQLYSEGTEDSGCGTSDKKRKSKLNMISDRNSAKLSVKVTEPDTPCSYKVTVSGPPAELALSKEEVAAQKAAAEKVAKDKLAAEKAAQEKAAAEKKAAAGCSAETLQDVMSTWDDSYQEHPGVRDGMEPKLQELVGKDVTACQLEKLTMWFKNDMYNINHAAVKNAHVLLSKHPTVTADQLEAVAGWIQSRWGQTPNSSNNDALKLVGKYPQLTPEVLDSISPPFDHRSDKTVNGEFNGVYMKKALDEWDEGIDLSTHGADLHQADEAIEAWRRLQ